MAEQLEKDFKNIDIDTVVGKVRSDIKEKIRKSIRQFLVDTNLFIAVSVTAMIGVLMLS